MDDRELCEWCLRLVPRTWWVRDPGDDEVRVCWACRNDYLYCLAGGRVPQDPGDD